MASDSTRDQAHSLHVWLMNEMQYDASGADGYHMIPTPKNLSELFCGVLPDVWRYLMENVYGPHTIHTIKGNLQLGSSARCRKLSSSEEKSLHDRRDAVSRSVRQTGASIQHLEDEIEKLQQEIVRKRATVRERREAVRREQRLTTCHRVHGAQSQAEARRTVDLARQLTLMSSGGEASDAAADKEQRDTACMRQIQAATDLLAGHIDRSLEHAPSADSLANAEHTVQQAVHGRPAAEILRGFAGLQQRAGLQLTRQLQLAERQAAAAADAQADRGNGDDVTRKIQASVDELHALHVTWRVKELTAQAEAKQLRRQLNQLKAQMSTDKSDELDWVTLHLESVAEQGRNGALELAVRQLNTEVEALAETRTALEQRYAAILSNDEIIEKNKSHIQLLVSLGRDSLSLTRLAQDRAATAAQRQLAPLLTALLTAQEQLTDDVNREADAVAARLLADIRYLIVAGQPVLWSRVPLWRPPTSDALLLERRLCSWPGHLLSLLDREQQRQRAAARAQALAQLRETAAAGSGSTAQQLEACRRRVQSQTEHERTQLMAQLERLFVSVSQMGGALQSARTALHNWSEQPARAACLQVQHAGLPLRVWEQRFVAATSGASRAQPPPPPPPPAAAH